MISPTRLRVLKALQLAVAVGMLVLFSLIYPGVIALFAGAVALCYILAAIFAMFDKRVGIWLAFGFTLLAFAFTLWGVYRYIDNGFQFLSGNFPGRAGLYWPAYLFLLTAIGALIVIVLHMLSADWMFRPERFRNRSR
jgi:hypothetical protein